MRYYERIGLLEPVGGVQVEIVAIQKDLDWIALFSNLRETGMPLAQILRFAELRRQGDSTSNEHLLLLEQHQRTLEQRMQKLEHHLTALQQKIAHKKAFLAQQDVTPHPVLTSEKSGF